MSLGSELRDAVLAGGRALGATAGVWSVSRSTSAAVRRLVGGRQLAHAVNVWCAHGGSPRLDGFDSNKVAAQDPSHIGQTHTSEGGRLGDRLGATDQGWARNPPTSARS